MGYCVTADIGVISFSGENIQKALDAINALHTESAMILNEACKDSSGRHYAWVDYPKGGFTSLEDALDEWRYQTYTAIDTGTVMVEEFEGEKWGDDEILWTALAPFIDPHVYATITWVGEDHAMWRYEFIDGKVVETYAAITWE